MTTRAETMSYWVNSASMPVFPKLDRDETVDVVVVGGGITGLTAAYLLTLSGRSVAVLERARCATIDTGHTTAHLTMVTDEWLTDLVKNFGRDHAQAVWEAGLAAIAQIDTVIRDERLSCDFEWVPGYLHQAPGTQRDDTQALQQEASLARFRGQALHRAEEDRVVCDDQFRPLLNRLGGAFGRDGKAGEDAPDLGAGIAEEQADVVPVAGQFQRREFVEVRGDGGHGLHDKISPGTMLQYTGQKHNASLSRRRARRLGVSPAGGTGEAVLGVDLSGRRCCNRCRSKSARR